MEELHHVETTLNYLADPKEKPAYYVHKMSAGTRVARPQVSRHVMRIHDGRELAPEPSLDEQGFTLTHQDSRVANFYDPDEVRAVYYPELERLVKEATGASRVHVFDHNVRCAPMAERGENGAAMPVKSAHNDYTERSGPQRVRDLLPDDAEELLAHRFCVINVWRPIRGPVQEMPLAVCDARSIAKEDLVATDLKYRHRTGEVYTLTFNPDHRWFYFPSMEQREVMLIKCYDSDQDVTARFTAHTAFEDPSSPPDAPARESIEVRTIAFFSPQDPG